jgi:hypothetical protein
MKHPEVEIEYGEYRFVVVLLKHIGKALHIDE